MGNEIWKGVSDYSGLFVSNMGRVKTIKGVMLSNQYNKGGYLIVKHKRKTLLVHRLVARAFISNPNNKPYVHHIDEDRANPTANNLMWVTPYENMNLGTMDKRYNKMVAIYPDGRSREFNSYKECAKIYMINPLEVLNVMRGQQETYMHMRFRWL